MPSIKVLILEDDEPTAKVYAETFRRLAGYDPVVCTRFEDARARLLQDLPDALLTDVRVGEFNGLHVARLFRVHAPHAPIVVVTGHDDPVIRRDAETLGATFLVKPIDVEPLIALLGLERS